MREDHAAIQGVMDTIARAVSESTGGKVAHSRVVKQVAKGALSRVAQVFIDLPSGDRIVCYAHILPAEQRKVGGDA